MTKLLSLKNIVPCSASDYDYKNIPIVGTTATVGEHANVCGGYRRDFFVFALFTSASHYNINMFFCIIIIATVVIIVVEAIRLGVSEKLTFTWRYHHYASYTYI